MPRHRSSSAFVLWVLLTSCSHPPPARVSPPPTPGLDRLFTVDYRVYPASPETVWVAVLAALGDQGYTLLEDRQDRWSISSEWTETPSRELTAGKGLFPGGERRGEEGVLNAMADLPETKGNVSVTTPTVGKEGTGGFSTTTRMGQEVGIWTKCRHRITARVVATAPDSCGVEARIRIECWEEQKQRTWVTCPSRGLLEAEFFAKLEERLGR